MDNVATLPIRDRRELFVETANRRRLAPIIVEKDFWVCWTLKRLFVIPEIGSNLIFKGGTSLSKAFGLIERFSEDVDISLRRDYLGLTPENDPEQPGLSRNQQRTFVERLRSACRGAVSNSIKAAIFADFSDALGSDGWQLKTLELDENTLLFQYPSALAATNNVDYIASQIRMEFGAGSDPYPISGCRIRSYAAEEFPAVFNEPECVVTTLAAERTFWEKATLIHAEFHRPTDRNAPARISRHYYDLARIAGTSIGANAIADLGLLDRVVAHKSVYFASSWANYALANYGGLRLRVPGERASALHDDYRAMAPMIFGAMPDLKSILDELERVETQVNNVCAHRAASVDTAV